VRARLQASVVVCQLEGLEVCPERATNQGQAACAVQSPLHITDRAVNHPCVSSRNSSSGELEPSAANRTLRKLRHLSDVQVGHASMMNGSSRGLFVGAMLHRREGRRGVAPIQRFSSLQMHPRPSGGCTCPCNACSSAGEVAPTRTPQQNARPSEEQNPSAGACTVMEWPLQRRCWLLLLLLLLLMLIRERATSIPASRVASQSRPAAAVRRLVLKRIHLAAPLVFAQRYYRSRSESGVGSPLMEVGCQRRREEGLSVPAHSHRRCLHQHRRCRYRRCRYRRCRHRARPVGVLRTRQCRSPPLLANHCLYRRGQEGLQVLSRVRLLVWWGIGAGCTGRRRVED